MAGACDTGRPHALDRIDQKFALGWDTTSGVGARGNCFGAREGSRPYPNWQMMDGRYIVTLVDTTVKPKRTVRGAGYPSSTGGTVLAVRGGGGDGFWGMRGSRSVGRVRRGFYCAGWIDA